MTLQDLKMLAGHLKATADKRAKEEEEMAREELYKSGARVRELSANYYKGQADAWATIADALEGLAC